MGKGRNSVSSQEVLGTINNALKREFDSNRRVLSFDEYLGLVGENPQSQLRGSARYLTDMLDFFGNYSISNQVSDTSPLYDAQYSRFKIFDEPVDGITNKIVDHEKVQHQLYRAIAAFSRQGINNKMILLHGPNGSAKSTMTRAIMGGLERYSTEPQGATYTFYWVFPIERYTKGGIGLNTYSPVKEPLSSYAKLPEEELAAKIPCDLKDHPILMIPQEHRLEFLRSLIGAQQANEVWKTASTYLTKGDLCTRCKQIFEALLIANNGDFKKVLMHVQVERFYYSRRYRKGLATIEPQLHVDAQYHQLSYQHKALSSLPASLQSLNLFTVTGDLIDGNRGITEFSDLLKRPVDSFKYLLGACESGSVNIGNSIAYLDTVMLGSTNEVQLDAFKEFPDFTSFKARIELIRVPYLLSVAQEKEIYTSQLDQISGEKHVTPHVAHIISLWAVLTRLKKPNSINYSPSVSTLISNIGPLDKTRLYDTGELPSTLSPEDRKLLRSSLKKIRDEYSSVPYYEGRIGASAREVKSVLLGAAQNPDYTCLSPLAVLRELEEFVKRVSEYEFLKQDIKEGYHDATEFINIVKTEYTNMVDQEIRDSMGIYEADPWEDFLKRYILQVSFVVKKEKIPNAITGKAEGPDFALISEFEKIVDAPQDAGDRDAFRQNIISRVGVWSLDHPNETVIYAKVFPEYCRKLERHYFESQKNLFTKMTNALQVYGTEEDDPTSEGAILVRQTIQNMVSKLHYCQSCAKEVISYLMRQRY